MKAKELMVGDWVIYGKKKHLCYNICGHTNDVLLDNGVLTNVMNLVPIPITPEILIKNGFSLEDYSGDIMTGKWWSRNDFVINVYMNDSVGRNNFKYEYVHQLQNAMRLCGIEKEIKL